MMMLSAAVLVAYLGRCCWQCSAMPPVMQAAAYLSTHCCCAHDYVLSATPALVLCIKDRIENMRRQLAVNSNSSLQDIGSIQTIELLGKGTFGKVGAAAADQPCCGQLTCALNLHLAVLGLIPPQRHELVLTPHECCLLAACVLLFF